MIECMQQQAQSQCLRGGIGQAERSNSVELGRPQSQREKGGRLSFSSETVHLLCHAVYLRGTHSPDLIAIQRRQDRAMWWKEERPLFPSMEIQNYLIIIFLYYLLIECLHLCQQQYRHYNFHLNSDQQMNIPNPYLQQQRNKPREEQPQPQVTVEPEAEPVDYQHHNYQEAFLDDYDGYHSQPSPFFGEGREEHYKDDARSENIPRHKPKKQKISKIHEKYLASEHPSPYKKSFRSERRPPQSKPFVNKFKKTAIETPNLQARALNPLSQGLIGLQIQTAPLKHQISLKSQSQPQKCELFSQLGLKQPKVLGKAKTQRQLQILMTFLQTGQLPEEYIADFLLLVSA